MKIFLDTNIILDFLQERSGFKSAKQIFDLAGNREYCRIYTSFLAIADSAYILRKTFKTDRLKEIFKSFMNFCNVLPMNDMQLYEAVRSGNSPDFEDNLQIMCAEHGGCDLIITNNVSHFRAHTDIPVLSPDEFISHCRG